MDHVPSTHSRLCASDLISARLVLREFLAALCSFVVLDLMTFKFMTSYIIFFSFGGKRDGSIEF